MTAPPTGLFYRRQGDFNEQEPKPKNNRTAFIVAAGVVTALALAGGAYAVTRAMGGGGDQPSGALPASTAAYMRVDINPTVGQKIAANKFIEGLDPEVTKTLKSNDIRKSLWDMAIEEEPDMASVDYDQDIAPWLGDRFGLGVIPAGDREPMVAAVLEVKDQSKAEASLNKMVASASEQDADLAWFFHGNYVVMTQDSDKNALQDAIDAGTLAKDGTFSADMAELGEEGVASGWMDLGALAPYAEQVASETVRGNSDPAKGPLLPWMGSGDDTATGRVAAALSFAEDNIQVHGVTRGMKGLGVEGGDSEHLVTHLPNDTAVAMGVEHGDQLLAKVWQTYKTQAPDEFAQMEAEASKAGFTLPGDAQLLLGKSMTISVGSDIVGAATSLSSGDGSMPSTLPIAYRVQTDTDQATGVIDKLLKQDTSGQASSALVRRADNGVLTLGIDKSYVDQVADGGSLGDQPGFKAAVPNAADADSVFYVNLDTFEQFYLAQIPDSEMRASVKSISGIGISAKSDADGNGEFTFRIAGNQ